MDFKHYKHSVGGSNYHFQFTPKYRRKIFLYGKVRRLCEALIRRKAHQLGVTAESIEFGPDHVHIFVTNCRKYSVSDLAFHFKGSTSYYIRKHAWNEVRNMLWGGSFWSDGYFYESVGRVTSDSIKYYIERQQGKHWEGFDHDFHTSHVKKRRYTQSSLTSFAG